MKLIKNKKPKTMSIYIYTIYNNGIFEKKKKNFLSSLKVP